MKKLFKLKEWLTIPDAAKHLSIVFDEDVSEADVLRLALDMQLQLSVYFVNRTTARRGKIFSPKLEKGKRGRCYIDREADWIMTSKLYEPYLFSIIISLACSGFGLF